MRTAKLTVAVCLLLAGTVWAQEKRSVSTDEKFNWQGMLKPGQSIEVFGVNGNIVARQGSDASVTTERRPYKSGDQPAHIEVVEHAGGVTVCAVYGKDTSPGKCEPGRGARTDWNWHGRNVSFEFTVQVPAGIKLVAHTTNGRVTAESLQSVIDAETTNGPIRVSTTEWARAETTNGSISVTMGKAEWTGENEISSTNGAIEVTLPVSTSTIVSAATTNGSIESELPITVQGSFRRTQLDGTIGQGGRDLRLRTTNGSIRLRRTTGAM